MSRGSDPPGLDEPDLQLWRRVAASVRPLHPQRSPLAEPPAETEPGTAAREEKAHPRPPAASTTPPPRVPALDHGVAPGLDKRTLIRLRRGQLPINGRLDLHGLGRVEAHHRLVEFLARAEQAGRRCVLVITGKGSRGDGVLRQEVPRWLNEPANRARVIAFSHAIPPDGGEGALYVLLRRRRR